MRRTVVYGLVCLVCLVGVGDSAVRAQQGNQLDSMIDTIRGMAAVGSGDQDRIRQWITNEISNFRELVAFRERFRIQAQHPGNGQAFAAQFPAQFAKVAETSFSNPRLNPRLAWALAQVLVDLNRVETLPALLSCLKSKHVVPRALCAKGLVAQRAAIGTDAPKLALVVKALADAGAAETSSAVLGRIFEALDYPSQVAVVFDTYIALLDRRVSTRRRLGGIADGVELFAYYFLQRPGVLDGLTAAQKTQLVHRLGVLLRLDAERYNAPNLAFEERDILERTIWSLEEILVSVVGSSGGKIRDEFQQGGYERRAQVLSEAYKWVGDPKNQTAGVLNAAPWNLPTGAP